MKITAGILFYRFNPQLEVFLVHPGGPFWKKKDIWGIPKGHVKDDEEIWEPLMDIVRVVSIVLKSDADTLAIREGMNLFKNFR